MARANLNKVENFITNTTAASRFWNIMSFSSHFSIFVFHFSLILADEVTKIAEYYKICLFTFFKSLACLALQTETIAKKIPLPKLSKMNLQKYNEPGINFGYTG